MRGRKPVAPVKQVEDRHRLVGESPARMGFRSQPGGGVISQDEDRQRLVGFAYQGDNV